MNYDNNSYLKKLNEYFMAANFLSVAQLYLLKNPLIKEPLQKSDIKKKIVGHWGTVPGQNFVYVHLNRIINKYDLNMILISGPGHGGNFFRANSLLEGVYSQIYTDQNWSEEGLTKFCKNFSFPGGVSSHVAPETPGSIHEGGELGYSLAHGFGAVLDNHDLIACVIVGDGEAETGPLANSWLLNKFINPKTDGVVLPVLHLNGYKISNPTIFSRLSHKEIKNYFISLGYKPYFVEGKRPSKMHRLMAKAMDKCVEDIKKIKKGASLRFPIIILRTPKGWTGPKQVDNLQIEGTFRAHQVPVSMEKEEHFDILKSWLNSYRPEKLFNEDYSLREDLANLPPKGNRRISANPVTNGGLLLEELKLPDIREFGVDTLGHGIIKKQDMKELGRYIAEVIRLNPRNFRLFSPDELLSNRLNEVLKATNRDFNAQILPTDESLAKDGRVIDSYLSEHSCEGMLEGYLLTGRHGIFTSYEAFIRVVDSMVSQHAKWLKVCNELPWRAPISSLNLLLTSNVWQQDHNGYTHQEPGFLDHVANKKADVARIYLPPDSNCLLSCYNHCQVSKNYVNVIVASKHPSYQWLSIDEAVEHCTKGISEWTWASTSNKKPDIILAACGDTPTVEALAALTILKKELPTINVRFVNVVDLMKLDTFHPHGLTEEEFDNIFTKDKPVIFNFHGYPNLIHGLITERKNNNFIVHGYQEEGTITTAFDMRVLNKIDRFHLVLSVLSALNLTTSSENIVLEMEKKLKRHKNYIKKYGVDMPEIENWKWE